MSDENPDFFWEKRDEGAFDPAFGENAPTNRFDYRKLNYLKVFDFQYNGYNVFPQLVLPDQPELTERARKFGRKDGKGNRIFKTLDRIGKAYEDFSAVLDFPGTGIGEYPEELIDYNTGKPITMDEMYLTLPVEKMKGREWLYARNEYSALQNLQIALVVAKQILALYQERGILVLDRFARNVFIEKFEKNEEPVVRQIDTEVIFDKNAEHGKGKLFFSSRLISIMKKLGLSVQEQGLWFLSSRLLSMMRKRGYSGHDPEGLCVVEMINNLLSMSNVSSISFIKERLHDLAFDSKDNLKKGVSLEQLISELTELIRMEESAQSAAA